MFFVSLQEGYQKGDYERREVINLLFLPASILQVSHLLLHNIRKALPNYLQGLSQLFVSFVSKPFSKLVSQSQIIPTHISTI